MSASHYHPTALPRPVAASRGGTCRRTVAQWLALVLAALLMSPVPEADAQYSGYHFGRNKIQYDQFDWHVMKTEHFDVYYYPEMQELAEYGAAFAEEAYEELQNRFSFALNHRVPLIFFSSNLHFKQTNITQGFIPDGVGGFFEFLKGRVVIPANGNLTRFRRVVRHEMVHVFMFNKLTRVMRDYRRMPDRLVPLWFSEGLAEYWSGEPNHDHEMVLRDAVYSNYLVPLESIYRVNGTFLMYKQGEAVFHFISDTYGEEKILEMLETFWVDKDFREVMELVTGDEFDTISDRWQAWLKRKYFPDLEDVEVPSLLTQQVAVEGFNSKPAYYRYRDGRRKVFFVSNRVGYSNVYEVAIDSLYRPVARPSVLIRGERNDRFEAFHLFESRLSVSPSGRLAFVTKSGGDDVIHVYDVERDEFEGTYKFPGLTAVYSPDWSPDGRRLVFSSIDDTGYADLYVYDLDHDRLERLTHDHYDDRDPSWSPDGARIAFSSDRTSSGAEGAYNLFTYEFGTGRIDYVTLGRRFDFSPRWSPDGRNLVFTSTTRSEEGHFSGKDIWVAQLGSREAEPAEVAGPPVPGADGLKVRQTELRRLTRFSSAAFDPVWTPDDKLIFTSFERFRFAIRAMSGLDSLMLHPRSTESVDVSRAGHPWRFDRILAEDVQERKPYRKRYRLDIAQGAVSQNAAIGTIGGAVLAFSDLMGDDYLYLTLFNNSTTERNGGFLKNMSFSFTRVQLKRRANIAYGIYRFSGRRYDITDPDASTSLPVFFETIYGGFGGLTYPLSKFKRIDLQTSLSWSDKEVLAKKRRALLLSNGISLIHDNALYRSGGPVAGWRAGITGAYTTDIRYSNVSYFTLQADVRKYFPITRSVSFASRVLGRWNQGREARLFFIGGSWDMRGFRLFRVRGQKMWFTSHELRFPILTAPSLITPVLSPFGISSLRGALFFDAAHAWNDDYYQLFPDIFAGETIGATGLGFRLNLFGGFVLRYDLGYRFRQGFRERERFFKQFFFGWDF